MKFIQPMINWWFRGWWFVPFCSLSEMPGISGIQITQTARQPWVDSGWLGLAHNVQSHYNNSHKDPNRNWLAASNRYCATEIGDAADTPMCLPLSHFLLCSPAQDKLVVIFRPASIRYFMWFPISLFRCLIHPDLIVHRVALFTAILQRNDLHSSRGKLICCTWVREAAWIHIFHHFPKESAVSCSKTASSWQNCQ